MQLTQDTNDSAYTIQSYEPGAVKINATIYTTSLIVTPDQLITHWPATSLADLQASHVGNILSLNGEIVIIGTGNKLEFPAKQLLAPLYNANIGVEIMDTGAACRTFNVLTAEHRQVIAALIINDD